MLPKLIVVLFLIAILVALFSGLFYLLRDSSDQKRVLRSLKWRVILQLLLIGFLILAFSQGWIRPHGLGG
jgi:succinate dehydrogenase hydrophobic anchor subunit